jgi:VWFA-related protein
VRVVANFRDGGRVVSNVRTRDLGYAERVRADAVLVPVIVRHNNQFVRGLKPRDFEVSEDGVAQSIANLAAEDAPLDLVVAIDISGSMEQALPDVRVAVKRLLSKLRPGDAATLVGFNDTAFVVAERETDPKVREEAVDLLTAWGGTALYDATVRVLDLVGTQWGRKGVVIFSDGDDRNSLTRRDAAMAKVQASDAVLYTVGFGSGATVRELQRNLDSYATTTGGHAFFPRDAKELDNAFDAIVSELANQYVISYSPRNTEHDDRWRAIKVRVRSGKYTIRARSGYRLDGSQLAEGK